MSVRDVFEDVLVRMISFGFLWIRTVGTANLLHHWENLLCHVMVSFQIKHREYIDRKSSHIHKLSLQMFEGEGMDENS